MSKTYSPKTQAIVEAAKAFAEQRKAEGWTKQDFLDGLKELLESDSGTTPKIDSKFRKRTWAARRVNEQREWISAHGGDIAGYVKRYGAATDPNKYGNGGEAIYAADKAALDEYEARLKELS